MSDEQWDMTLDVNLRAPFRILRAAQPIISSAVKEEGQTGNVRCRKVVNVSSIARVTGNAGQANYAAAKCGLAGLSRTLSKEWGRYNVTVDTIAFGIIETRTSESLTENAPDDQCAWKATIGRRQSRSADYDEAPHAASTDRHAWVYLFCLLESDYVTGQTAVCSGGLTVGRVISKSSCS